MDEATSNIDSENENKINEYLHTKLKDKTIISIVHRTQTVMNYDKILVLDNGNIIEYDSPKNLMNNTNSYFARTFAKSV